MKYLRSPEELYLENEVPVLSREEETVGTSAINSYSIEDVHFRVMAALSHVLVELATFVLKASLGVNKACQVILRDYKTSFYLNLEDDVRVPDVSE